MKALIITDEAVLGAKLTAIAQRCGVECDSAEVAQLDTAAQALSHSRHELVMLVVPRDQQRALSLLRNLRRAVPGILLVIGQADDPKFIISVLREGANEFVDRADLEVDLEAALSRLRSKQQLPSGEQGQVIAVLGCGGGVGASTLVANVATSLAKEHSRCALLDMRLAASDQALLLDLKPVHTLGELCEKGERMDSVLFQQVLTAHPSGVQLLASPLRDDAIAHVTAHAVRQVVMLSRNLFPFTVIDLDRTLGPEQLAVLVQSDVIMLVFRLDMTSLCSAQRLLDQLNRLGVPESRIKIVVNRHGQPKELPAGRAERVLGVDLAHYIPDDPATVNSSNNKGVPVVIERPKSRIARSLAQLAQSVVPAEAGQVASGARNGHAERGLLSRLWPAAANGRA